MESVFGGRYEVRAVDWGDMHVSFEKALEEADVTPYLKGLPDDLDPCPHWGFVIKGSVVFKYKGHEEVVNAGEAYYAAPGHTAIVAKGTELIEFSPANEFKRTNEVVAKNMQATPIQTKR